MARDASELPHRLAREAEAVCRHYLSNGKRQGRYWLVGDVHNTPGRSMFVRLQDSPKGPAGKWTDAATGEHGDLLDIVRESLGLRDFHAVAEEARRFLKLPRTEPERVSKSVRPTVAAGLVTQFASAWPMTTCLSRARASRPCYRYAVCFPPCRWHQRFQPITCRPCCCRRVCAGSISPAMPMLREMRSGQS